MGWDEVDGHLGTGCWRGRYNISVLSYSLLPHKSYPANNNVVDSFIPSFLRSFVPSYHKAQAPTLALALALSAS